MKINELTGSPDPQKLAALAQFLIGRAGDTNASKTISTDAFIKLAQRMGVSLTQQQLSLISQNPPLNGLITNVEPDKITFKGAEPEVDDSDMTPDQAQATVDKMAKRATKKKGL